MAAPEHDVVTPEGLLTFRHCGVPHIQSSLTIVMVSFGRLFGCTKKAVGAAAEPSLPAASAISTTSINDADAGAAISSGHMAESAAKEALSLAKSAVTKAQRAERGADQALSHARSAHTEVDARKAVTEGEKAEKEADESLVDARVAVSKAELAESQADEALSHARALVIKEGVVVSHARAALAEGEEAERTAHDAVSSARAAVKVAQTRVDHFNGHGDDKHNVFMKLIAKLGIVHI